MKTEKLVLAIFSLSIIGCTTNELEESLDVKENKTKAVEIRGDDNSSNCDDTNRTIKIKWIKSPTHSEKQAIRTFFERDFGKHPLIVVDPDGIRETWIFNLSMIPLPPSLGNSNIEDCDRADDVVRTAVTAQEEVELD